MVHEHCLTGKEVSQRRTCCACNGQGTSKLTGFCPSRQQMPLPISISPKDQSARPYCHRWESHFQWGGVIHIGTVLRIVWSARSVRCQQKTMGKNDLRGFSCSVLARFRVLRRWTNYIGLVASSEIVIVQTVNKFSKGFALWDTTCGKKHQPTAIRQHD